MTVAGGGFRVEVRGRRLRSSALAVVLSLLVLSALAGGARGAMRWSTAQTVDAAQQIANPLVTSGISCPSSVFCVAVGGAKDTGEIATTAPGTAAGWRLTPVAGTGGFSSVACPSLTLCAAVGAGGDIVTSSSPATGAWTNLGPLLSNAQTGLGGIACPAVNLCVAVSGTNEILWTTDPLGGAGAWTKVPLGTDKFARQLDGVSCPSTTLCLISDFDGAILSSTDPTGPASAWKVVSPPNAQYLNSVSCASATACVVVDGTGDVLTSTTPTGAGSTWQQTNVDGANNLNAVDCPLGTTTCIAVDTNGNALSFAPPNNNTTTPTYLTAKGLDPAGFGSIGCAPAAAICVAGDLQGRFAVTAPSASGRTGAWQISPQLGTGTPVHPTLSGVSCPSALLCVAVDAVGNAVTSVRPTGQAIAWHTTSIRPGMPLSAVACASATACTAVGGSGFMVSTARPTAGGGAWTLDALDLHSTDDNGEQAFDSLIGLGCAPGLCVAARYGNQANLEVSSNPLSPVPTWNSIIAGDSHVDFFRAVACPSASLCVAPDAQTGRVATSTDHGRHWKLRQIEPRSLQNGSLTPGFNSISCPTTRFCVIVGDSGVVETTTTPTAGGAANWHLERIDGRHELDDVSCPTTGFCAAEDARGNVLVTSDPGAAHPVWSATHLGFGLTDISCGSPTLCVVTAKAGVVYVGTGRA